MKKIVLLAGVAILAACSKPAPEEPATEEAAATPDSAMAAVGGPGTYEVTYADGSTGTMVSSEDNTFTFTRGDQSASGTVEEKDGKVCYTTTEGEQAGTRCWANEAPGEDGSWSSTADDGEVVTVKKVE